jgi:tetratricopeptide (TPR) repeat protein
MVQRTKGTKIWLLAFGLIAGNLSNAQVLAPDQSASRELTLIEQQYHAQNYTFAAQSARQYLSEPATAAMPENNADKEKARYFLALSGIKKQARDCKEYAIQFIKSTSVPAYKQRLQFALAQYYFQHDQLTNAIPLYVQAGIANLDNNEIADAKFELAYCYFNNRQFDKAEPLLQAIKELPDGKYYMAGNYYYGLLAYNENKYKAALQSFDRIKDQKEYSTIVPYYMAEIYYFMGNRDQALKLSLDLLTRKEKSYYDNELHLLAAQCLFEVQDYKEAKPYFEYYYGHKDKIRKQELYEMAYCDYKTADWEAAVEKFKLLSDAQDSLGQTSMYLLGDCYLKMDEKASSRNAFGICADMAFNRAQQEASMFIYSKISDEEGFNDDALRQLTNLLKTFPGTQYKDEANTMISGLLVKTNNYAGALSHLKEVNHKEADYWQIYQKASYGFAVQRYREGEPGEAKKYLDQSLDRPVNVEYEAVAYFWKSELCYHEKRYEEVLKYARDFIDNKGDRKVMSRISPLATIQHAWLNMGFAAMGTQDYEQAQEYFSKAQENDGHDAYTGMVATLREADAVFMQKNFGRAMMLYDKIIASDSADRDYARYQKSIILGLQGKTNEKIDLLKSIIYHTPPSVYADHARYEIAVTYMDADKYQPALVYLHQLADSVNDKSFAPSAWIKTGFIYQQMGEPVKAIEAYKRVITDYPGSEDKLAALDALKSLYIATNQPASYSRLLRENHLPSADSGSIDSTFYSAAEAQYSNGRTDEAAKAFTSYLQQYPNGIFATKAHYYRGESYYQLKQYKEARSDYDAVLAGPWNEFDENSARHAGSMAYEAKDYDAAFRYYNMLGANASNDLVRILAWEGMEKSTYNTARYNDAAHYADSLMAMPGAPVETLDDALYIKASSLYHADSASDTARVLFTKLAANKNRGIAAEARYCIAHILYVQGKFKEAEDAANDAIHLSSGYDYWIVRSYLLLADILTKEQDFFNAKATLESIVKHTKIAEAKQEAQRKLDALKELEKKKSKLSED